ncbi:uncharacterized protein KY384_001779 [Bacidia gigantensis]|uniref:uncharacterized protein n=1 Tax=Bacidia gigantensis TaxID=2732470 RepID=UPI001D056A89|nr:uncharacterized protein KY384_001779 [Bacidia gigantensis]KAG8532997.1 hypothetical protein KY384_001779 [Bacidia gigantensis]
MALLTNPAEKHARGDPAPGGTGIPAADLLDEARDELEHVQQDGETGAGEFVGAGICELGRRAPPFVEAWDARTSGLGVGVGDGVEEAVDGRDAWAEEFFVAGEYGGDHLSAARTASSLPLPLPLPLAPSPHKQPLIHNTYTLIPHPHLLQQTPQRIQRIPDKMQQARKPPLVERGQLYVAH